jgi:hypothetical protein
MAMSWVEAVKAYCAKKGCKYTIPRKGSPEYAEVKAMMGGAAAPAEKKEEAKEAPAADAGAKKSRKAFEGLMEERKKAKAPKAPKAEKMVAAAKGVVAKVSAEPKEAKAVPRRKRAPKKAADSAVLSEAAGVPLPKPKVKRVSREVAIANQIARSEGVTALAAKSSSNPEMLLNNAANVHDPIAPPAALAGDLSALKADVAKVRKPRALPKLVEPERVVNEAPFDMLAFRRKLGC